jgi:hypothetical protein
MVSQFGETTARVKIRKMLKCGECVGRDNTLEVE